MQEKSYKEYLQDITTFIFDVDGVLTEGKVLVTNEGELLRSMSVKDGFALKMAVDFGYHICIITGGNNQGAKKRLEGLGIKDIYMECHHKTEAFKHYLKKNNIRAENVLYMGDDIPDIAPMKCVKLACSPQDAVPEVKEISDYVSHIDGGKGCVRDVIRQVMKVQGKWDKVLKIKE